MDPVVPLAAPVAPVAPPAPVAPVVVIAPVAPPAPQAPVVAPAKPSDAPTLSPAQIASLQAQAAQWEAHQAQQATEIAATRATLAPHQQKAVDAAASIEGKRDILAMIAADKAAAIAAQPGHRPAVNGAPPAPNDAIDFAAAWRDPAVWAEAKARDPKGASAWFAARSVGGLSSITSLSSLSRAPTKTA